MLLLIYGNDISTINQAHATTSIENDRTTITRDHLSSGMQYLYSLFNDQRIKNILGERSVN